MLAARPAPAAAPDIFTVANVPVDATAANASAARDQARADGERRAYAILIGRLTLDADRGRLPPPTEALLNDLIAGFEVASERASGVRYLAKYTFHFRPDAVRELLRSAGIPFGESPSKPLVVLARDRGAARRRSCGKTRIRGATPGPRIRRSAASCRSSALWRARGRAGDRRRCRGRRRRSRSSRRCRARYGGADVLVATAEL